MVEQKQPDLVPVSFKFTSLGRELLEKLARSEGLSMTGYLETTLRRLARERCILNDEEKKESETG